MKRIPLKKVAVTTPEGKEEIMDYKELLEKIVRSPSDRQRGMDINEIRSSLKVLDALEKADGEFIELEDADFAFMSGKVHEARFFYANHAVLQFVDDVTGAT